MNLKISGILVLLMCFSTSCEKDKLVDEYDAFEGRWRWVHTMSRSSIFDNWRRTLRPAVTGYDGTIELHDDETISFYKNDGLLANTKFRLKSQSTDNGNLFLDLDFDINENGLELNGKRSFSIINDTLYFTGFPFNGYEEGTDYSTTHQVINNGIFVRQ